MRELESDLWKLRRNFKPKLVVNIQSLTQWEDLLRVEILKTDMGIYALLFPGDFIRIT